MAFTRATGRHRRPGRLVRSRANLAGIAGLAAGGAVAGLAHPAGAAPAKAPEPVGETGLRQAVRIDDSLPAAIGAQADQQKRLADRAAAKAEAEAEAEAARRAAEKRKADEARRAAEERAAREERRKRLGAYVLPVAGSAVTTPYRASGGAWSSGSHSGVDFRAASGTPVRAVGPGTVVEAGWGGAYGNNVVIKHNDGTYTQYGHLVSLTVSAGRTVTPGQQIGLSGSTGNSTGPHLHFEARTSPVYGSDVDPVAYLRSHGVSL